MAKIRKIQNDADYGRVLVDDQLQDLEERLTDLYARTSSETKKDLDTFLNKYQDKDREKRAQVQSGEISEQDYIDWRNRMIFRTETMTAKVNDLTQQMLHADQTAMMMIKDELPQIYATSWNFGGFRGETFAEAAGFDYTQFTIVNADAVRILATKDPDLIPWKPEVDVSKDKKWNRQHIQSAIQTGIVKGDAIPDIADRLMPVVNMDRTAAVRTARTAVTGVENKGRKDATERVKEAGIPMVEAWSCTHDARTRDTHILMDKTLPNAQGLYGEGIVEGNLLEYPADPNGDPSEVYNCRCSLVSTIKGIDHSKDDELYAQMMEAEYYEDWVKVKEDRQEKEAAFQRKKEGAAERVAEKMSKAEETTESAKSENIVTAIHVTSDKNIDAILDEGFDLSHAGEGAGTVWGDGVYFSTGETEQRFYSIKTDSKNAVEAEIDTSNMLNIDLGNKVYDSSDDMYKVAVKQLPEDLQKEYKQLYKELKKEDPWSANKEAFETVVKDNYTGLVITQDLNGGIDSVSGGNQIVIFDTDAINITGKVNVDEYQEKQNEQPEDAEEILLANKASELPDDKIIEITEAVEENATTPEPFETRKFDGAKDAVEYFRGSTRPSMVGAYRDHGFSVAEDTKKPATQWASKLTRDQSSAIFGYTRSGYMPVNGYLRGEIDKKGTKEMIVAGIDSTSGWSVDKYVKTLDAAIGKFDLKEPITVYRTCEREFLDKLEIGGTFHDEGFGSTSVLSVPVASGDVHLTIDVPAGKGVGAYIDGESAYEGEEFEFLLARGADYYIKDIRYTDEGVFIDAVITGTTK